MSDERTKVLVLGGTGMLGAMVAEVFSCEPGFAVSATAREEALRRAAAERLPGVAWLPFDADLPATAGALLSKGGFAWAVNCIGVIKPYIKDDDSAKVRRALRVNAMFPHVLADAAAASGCRVLQIATDCVYSGREGRYGESALHDATDVYGKTKSLGEAVGSDIHHLRCSIIGPEPRNGVSLLEWFLGQREGASVTGFTNHMWNGVTTLHFAKVCAGIVREGIVDLPNLQHVVPGDAMAKADMLSAFAAAYGREDIQVNRGEAKVVIDRTLSTERPEVSARVWKAAGYATPPTVGEMIAEMGRFGLRLKPLVA